MERIRPLTAAGLAGLVALSGGCLTADRVSRRVSESVQAATPWPAESRPASIFTCTWEPRLAHLPDPTRDGTPSAGLVGQVFLFGPDGQAVDVAGDVTVAVYDETPRPPGVPAQTTEVFHFTKDVVKQLRTSDERFGRCYALFLPWPAGWQSVTAVRVLARYDPPAGPPLQAGDNRITISTADPTAPVWSKPGEAGMPAPVVPTAADTRSVPDGAKMLRQVSAAAPAAATWPLSAVPIPPQAAASVLHGTR